MAAAQVNWIPAFHWRQFLVIVALIVLISYILGWVLSGITNWRRQRATRKSNEEYWRNRRQ